MIRTLRRRFIFVTLSTLLVLLLVLAGCIIAAGYFQMESSADAILRMLASGDLRPPPPANTRNPAFGYQIRPGPMPMRYFVAAVEENGQVTPIEQLGVSEEDQKNLSAYCPRIKSEGKTNGKVDAYKYWAIPAEKDRLIIAFLDNSIQAQMLSELLMTSVWVISGCMLLIFLVSMPVSSWAAWSYLGNVEKQRQFITNAGHELKTPVAIIQSNVDAMELIEGGNKWTRNIRSQTERLSQLVRQLLLLARMEEGSASRPFEKLDFGALIQNEIACYAEAVASKALSLELSIGEKIFVNGNADALTQLLHILMDNAAGYTEQGGRIAVRLTARGRKAQFCVRNSTDVLPDAPPDMLFERFYRADSTRARHGGYGIGLSAARLIVETHRGKINATYEGGRNILITAEMPISKQR